MCPIHGYQCAGLCMTSGLLNQMAAQQQQGMSHYIDALRHYGQLPRALDIEKAVQNSNETKKRNKLLLLLR